MREPQRHAARRGRETRALERDCKLWLGREDSNLRMAESKSAALPLGYAPISQRFSRLVKKRADNSSAFPASQWRIR